MSVLLSVELEKAELCFALGVRVGCLGWPLVPGGGRSAIWDWPPEKLCLLHRVIGESSMVPEMLITILALEH